MYVLLIIKRNRRFINQIKKSSRLARHYLNSLLMELEFRQPFENSTAVTGA